MSSPTLSSRTVTVFSARIESDSGDKTYDKESTNAGIQITDTDTSKAMSTTSLQNSYTRATSCKCGFLLLSLPHQPVSLLNIQRTLILTIVFSQQQQKSHLKKDHWWCNNFVLTAGTKKKKSQGYCCVKRRKAADVKENLEYGGGEVHERVSVCDLLSCSSLEGTVKYLMLSEDQQEPVKATALWAKN